MDDTILEEIYIYVVVVVSLLLYALMCILIYIAESYGMLLRIITELSLLSTPIGQLIRNILFHKNLFYCPVNCVPQFGMDGQTCLVVGAVDVPNKLVPQMRNHVKANDNMTTTGNDDV